MKSGRGLAIRFFRNTVIVPVIDNVRISPNIDNWNLINRCFDCRIFWGWKLFWYSKTKDVEINGINDDIKIHVVSLTCSNFVNGCWIDGSFIKNSLRNGWALLPMNRKYVMRMMASDHSGMNCCIDWIIMLIFDVQLIVYI